MRSGWTGLTRGRAGFAVAAAGLVLALASVASSRRGSVADGSAQGLAVHLPGWVIACVFTLAAASILIMFVLAQPARRRGGRKKRDEVLMWAQLLLWTFALVPLAAATHSLWYDRIAPLMREMQTREGLLRATGLSRLMSPEPGVSSPLFDAAVALLALLVGLAGFVFVLWVALDGRLASALARRRPESTADALRDAVEESLDELRRDPDARRAIIKCYRRFEVASARSGLAREPWETPTEFMRAAARDRPRASDAVERLTRLFERARFGHHPMGLAERDAACASVGEIGAALEGDRANASTA